MASGERGSTVPLEVREAFLSCRFFVLVQRGDQSLYFNSILVQNVLHRGVFHHGQRQVMRSYLGVALIGQNQRCCH